MEALSSSRFSSRFPTLLDPVSKPPKPSRRRRLLQTLASIPADAAGPSPPPRSLSRLLAAALRGGRIGSELPDLVSAGGAGGAGIGTLLMSTTAAAVTKARESPYILALAANPTFVSGMLAFAVAQAAKVVLTSVVERRWSPRMLCSSGGMPSSHSALCTALTASVALCHGVRDALFPVCLGFSLIVMYDATGVRRHAGMQAEVLRRLKKVCHESQQDNKRPADSEHFSVPPIHTRHMKSNSASTSDEEREDMIPISGRMKRRHLETKHEDASYEVKPNLLLVVMFSNDLKVTCLTLCLCASNRLQRRAAVRSWPSQRYLEVGGTKVNGGFPSTSVGF